MAWGPDANTEQELEKLAAVRAYFEEAFPGAEVRNSYDSDRLAQVFQVEIDRTEGFRDAVLLTEFLEEHSAGNLGKMLASWRVAENLRSAKEIVVTSWGLEGK